MSLIRKLNFPSLSNILNLEKDKIETSFPLILGEVFSFYIELWTQPNFSECIFRKLAYNWAQNAVRFNLFLVFKVEWFWLETFLELPHDVKILYALFFSIAETCSKKTIEGSEYLADFDLQIPKEVDLIKTLFIKEEVQNRHMAEYVFLAWISQLQFHCLN